MTVTQPKLDLIDERKYKLTEDYIFTWTKDARHLRLTIPAGTITDIASVPQIFWSLGFTPDGLHRPAALIHDYIYSKKGKLPPGVFQVFDEWVEDGKPQGKWISADEFYCKEVKWSRHDADRLFVRVMKDAGTKLVKRRLMYRSVRMFGWISGGINW